MTKRKRIIPNEDILENMYYRALREDWEDSAEEGSLFITIPKPERQCPACYGTGMIRIPDKYREDTYWIDRNCEACMGSGEIGYAPQGKESTK